MTTPRRRPVPALLAAALAGTLAVVPATARGQDGAGGDQPVDPYGAPASPSPAPDAAGDPGDDPAGDPAGDPADDIDAQVAQALLARGVFLLERGDTADARTLFIESLQRSPRGPAAGEALRRLREANRALGLDPDAGRPSAGEGVMDPYGDGGDGAAPEGPLDPYGEGGQGAGPAEAEGPGSPFGNRAAIAWSAAVGFVNGLAIAGPESGGEPGDPDRDVSGGAILAGVIGGAAGAGLGWWLTERRPLSAGEAATVVSAANWGALELGLFGDAVTGTDSDPNDVWKFVAVGGLLGIGGGAALALRASPSEGDVAFVNSLGLYGAAAGILAGVGMQPPHNEAYSINALVASTAGLTAGFFLQGRVETSRRRTLLMDAGAAAGALVPWVVLYPFISDGDTENDEQVAGWLSVFTLGGGAVAAWYLTRGMDDDEGGSEAAAARHPAPPALARREADGAWRLGAPLLRPMALPAIAPASGTALGVDILSGRF